MEKLISGNFLATRFAVGLNAGPGLSGLLIWCVAQAALTAAEEVGFGMLLKHYSFFLLNKDHDRLGAVDLRPEHRTRGFSDRAHELAPHPLTISAV